MDDKKLNTTILSAFIIAASIIAAAVIISERIPDNENTLQSCMKEARKITSKDIYALKLCTPD